MRYANKARSMHQYRIDLLKAVLHRVKLRRERERLKTIKDISDRKRMQRSNYAAMQRTHARITYLKERIALLKDRRAA